MKRIERIAFLVAMVLMFSIINIYAQYDFLSEESNLAINRFKENYGIYGYYVSGEYYIPYHRGHIVEPSPFLNDAVQLLREKYVEQQGFIWGVILPEHYGKDVVEYKQIIEGKIYTVTEITILNPQGSIKVIWGSGAKFHPYDVPKIVVKH